jgi:hypothetical protein
MSNISQFLKLYNHSWEYKGISIEVEIEYCSKDYIIRMLFPIDKVLCYNHMIYAVSVVYGILEGEHSVHIKSEGNVRNLLYVAQNECERYLDSLS